MASENGTGEGGGNSSVWWQIRHGSTQRPQQLAGAGSWAGSLPAAAGAGVGVGVVGRPAAGEVKLTNSDNASSARVEIHDNTDLRNLGGTDHQNMFRVRLRIRRQEIDAMIKADPSRRSALEAYWTTLSEIAPALSAHTGAPPGTAAPVVSKDEVYLVVDVPAITRKPAPDEAWPDLPWELYWQW